MGAAQARRTAQIAREKRRMISPPVFPALISPRSHPVNATGSVQAGCTRIAAHFETESEDDEPRPAARINRKKGREESLEEKKKRAAEVFRRLGRALSGCPHRPGLLEPLELLVATILSAQMHGRARQPGDPGALPPVQDRRRLCPRAGRRARRGDSPDRVLQLQGQEPAPHRSRPGGRARGQRPRNDGGARRASGVGRKTANVILGNAFGKDEGFVVDTHVGRLARRLGFTRQTDPVKVENDLIAIVPQGQRTLDAHRLIFHGRQICVARKPRCEVCPVLPSARGSDWQAPEKWMWVSCLAFCKSRRKTAGFAESPSRLESRRWQKASHRNRLRRRGAVCGVGAPLRCAPASPSSRLLASGPAALATPPTPFSGACQREAPRLPLRRDRAFRRRGKGGEAKSAGFSIVSSATRSTTPPGREEGPDRRGTPEPPPLEDGLARAVSRHGPQDHRVGPQPHRESLRLRAGLLGRGRGAGRRHGGGDHARLPFEQAGVRRPGRAPGRRVGLGPRRRPPRCSRTSDALRAFLARTRKKPGDAGRRETGDEGVDRLPSSVYRLTVPGPSDNIPPPC